jgi:hypothetical protein
VSVGSVLVGTALLLVVGIYLARPFRAAQGGADLDQVIEAWVAQVRAEGWEGREAEEKGEEEAERIAYCPQCGRRVGPGDRFCAGCGTRLRGGAA